MGGRSYREQSDHDRAVIDIAARHMSFPGWPNLATFVNEPYRSAPVSDGLLLLYPDIVIVDHLQHEAVLLGEVETDSTVNTVSAEQWHRYAGIAPLHLFVPPSKVMDAVLLTLDSSITVHLYWFDTDGAVYIT
jgi:hypothetical protein